MRTLSLHLTQIVQFPLFLETASTKTEIPQGQKLSEFRWLPDTDLVSLILPEIEQKVKRTSEDVKDVHGRRSRCVLHLRLHFPSLWCISLAWMWHNPGWQTLKTWFKTSQLLTHRWMKYSAAHLNSQCDSYLLKNLKSPKPGQNVLSLTSLYMFIHTATVHVCLWWSICFIQAFTQSNITWVQSKKWTSCTIYNIYIYEKY